MMPLDEWAVSGRKNGNGLTEYFVEVFMRKPVLQQQIADALDTTGALSFGDFG